MQFSMTISDVLVIQDLLKNEIILSRLKVMVLEIIVSSKSNIGNIFL